MRGWMVAALVWGIGAGVAQADPLAERMRAVVGRHAPAVVTVRLVIKEHMAFGGESNEYEGVLEVTGTVIQPDGLTVTALSSVDPTSQFADMLEAMSDDMPGMKAESRIGKVTLIGGEGKETEAAVVLRDKDLDLAFLRPSEKPAAPWPHVALDAAAAAEAFDEVVVPYRMGKVAQRMCTATAVRVLGVMQKPRRLYVLGDWVATETGGAALNEAGAAIGVVVMRRIQQSPSELMSMMDSDGGMSAVIVPSAAVLESAAQAPAQAPAEPASPPDDAKPAAPAASESAG